MVLDRLKAVLAPLNLLQLVENLELHSMSQASLCLGVKIPVKSKLRGFSYNNMDLVNSRQENKIKSVYNGYC